MNELQVWEVSMSEMKIISVLQRWASVFIKVPNIVKHVCKKCGAKEVYFVGPFRYTEHCRICDNWQASF